MRPFPSPRYYCAAVYKTYGIPLSLGEPFLFLFVVHTKSVKLRELLISARFLGGCDRLRGVLFLFFSFFSQASKTRKYSPSEGCKFSFGLKTKASEFVNLSLLIQAVIQKKGTLDMNFERRQSYGGGVWATILTALSD